MQTKKGPNEKKFDLDGSYADAFAQRAVLAGFLLNELGPRFVSQDPCRKEIAKKVYKIIGKGKWERGESPAKLETDSGRYFAEWFNFKHAASQSTLRAFIQSSPQLAYLEGMESLNAASPLATSHTNSLVRLALALRALEMESASAGQSIYEAKKRLAEQVIIAIAKCWEPDGHCIQLAPFRIGGWGNLDEGKKPSTGTAFRGMKIYKDRMELETTEQVARRWSPEGGIGVLDYLLALAADKHPLPIGAALRWGMDVLAAAIAARCLVVCEAMPDSAAKRGARKETLAFHAESLDGVMQAFCYRRDSIEPKAQLRVLERIISIDTEERDDRAIWFLDSVAHAAKLFQRVCHLLTPGLTTIVTTWHKHQLKLPLSVPTKVSAPVESALHAVEKVADPVERVAFLSAFEKPEEFAAREPAAAPYAPPVVPALGSDAWRNKIDSIFRRRLDFARDIYDRATAENRGPSREDYRNILRLSLEDRAEVRSTAPGATLKDIRNAYVTLKPAPNRRRKK